MNTGKFPLICQEAFVSGTEIVRLARMVQGVDINGSTPEEIDMITLKDKIQPFFKDYDASLDQKVLAAMMKVVKERVPAQYLPDIYQKVDKKYKGDYAKYAADVFKKTSLLSYDKIEKMLKDPKLYAKLKRPGSRTEFVHADLFVRVAAALWAMLITILPKANACILPD